MLEEMLSWPFTPYIGWVVVSWYFQWLFRQVVFFYVRQSFLWALSCFMYMHVQFCAYAHSCMKCMHGMYDLKWHLKILLRWHSYDLRNHLEANQNLQEEYLYDLKVKKLTCVYQQCWPLIKSEILVMTSRSWTVGINLCTSGWICCCCIKIQVSTYSMYVYWESEMDACLGCRIFWSCWKGILLQDEPCVVISN